MKRKNATRSALFTSIISLLLCVSMLVGTTFAWFTDSVVSGVNVINAGNLDVELYHGKTAEPTEKVDNTDKLFTDFENNLIEWWEPGVVAYTNLKVANVGTLALKYQLALNFSNASAVEYEGKTYTLADVLKVAVVKNGFTGDRAAAQALDYKYTLSSFELKGELKGDETTDTYGIVVYWEPGSDDYDNIFNLNNGKTNTEGGKTLSIDLGVNLFASQLEYEEDSFDINYDKNAAIFVSTTAELQAAINNVQNNGTICLNDGTYDISSQLTVPGKSVNFVGVGENVVINMTDTRVNYNKIFYIYGSATEGEDVTVNISNVTLTAPVPTKSDIWIRTDAQNGTKVKGNVTVNLDNVNCTSVICDNNYVDGDTVNLNVYDSAIAKVTLDASPFNGNGLNTYTNLTYKDSRIDHINIQNGAAQALGNITINGVNPTATGEQQAYTYASSAAELQEVLDAAGVGDHYIVLFADITGNVIATQKEGVNITIDGADHEYDGSIEIYGQSRYTGAETLTIKNINFVADEERDFVHCNDAKDGTKRYAHNVTIEGCTFTSTTTEDVVAARFRQCYNITIKDCKATGLHSVMWATGVSNGLVVDNVTANCKSGGISTGTSVSATIKNSTITVTGDYGYGVRADASGAYKLTVENSNINADAPVLVRNAKGNATVILNQNTLNSAKGNEIILTNTDYVDDSALPAPTGKITLIIDGVAAVDSAEVLTNLLGANVEDISVVLAGNQDYGTVTLGTAKNVEITGAEGTTLIFKTDANTKLENVTLKSVGFEYTGATADCGIVIDANAQIDNLVVDGCTFTGTGAKAGRGLSGLNNNATIVLKNCDFKNLGYPIYAWGGYEALTIEGCTFDNIKSWAIMPQSGFDGDLTVTGCTFSNCLGGGLIKAGTLTAGHTFTFTDNIITNCTVAGDHNWFQFNVSAGTTVISGNTMDGASWIPGVSEGLK